MSKEAITALRNELAKQEQGEPNYKVTVIDNQHPNGVPLEQWGYTTPQQRTWVGLTDEQMRKICGSVATMREAVREAEAILKEGNT